MLIPVFLLWIGAAIFALTSLFYAVAICMFGAAFAYCVVELLIMCMPDNSTGMYVGLSLLATIIFTTLLTMYLYRDMLFYW